MTDSHLYREFKMTTFLTASLIAGLCEKRKEVHVMLLLLLSEYHETISILDLRQYLLIPRKSLVNTTQLIKLLNSN